MALLTASLPVETTDEELLSRSQSGDRQALEMLFARHRQAAYQVAYRLLGHEADALDAVQEGFIKVLTNLRSFEGRSSFKTWLLRVVSNSALDLGRSRGRRGMLSLQSVGVANEQPAPELTDDLERADLRRLLSDALDSLPEAQRRTFVLHVDGELSYREVAEALGISIGTVMSRLFYARQKLKDYLAERMRT